MRTVALNHHSRSKVVFKTLVCKVSVLAKQKDRNRCHHLRHQQDDPKDRNAQYDCRNNANSLPENN